MLGIVLLCSVLLLLNPFATERSSPFTFNLVKRLLGEFSEDGKGKNVTPVFMVRKKNPEKYTPLSLWEADREKPSAQH